MSCNRYSQLIEQILLQRLLPPHLRKDSLYNFVDGSGRSSTIDVDFFPHCKIRMLSSFLLY